MDLMNAMNATNAGAGAALGCGCGCGLGAGLGRGMWQARRAFLKMAGAGGAAALAGAAPVSALAQVDVGAASRMRHLVSAEDLERAAQQQYAQLVQQARQQGALVDANDAQVLRLKAIARRLVPFAQQWNSRAKNWEWGVVLIRSQDVNAFCMPGGKIAFYTGILQRLKLTDDEAAMVMGHEMAHALREHSREQMAKNTATNIGISIGAQLLGLGDVGNFAAQMGAKLLSLKFSRSDEREADLVGLEMAARAGFVPQSAVNLWQKMGQVTGGGSGLAFLSTHPSGPDRIRELQANVPKVQGLYEKAAVANRVLR